MFKQILSSTTIRIICRIVRRLYALILELKGVNHFLDTESKVEYIDLYIDILILILLVTDNSTHFERCECVTF